MADIGGPGGTDTGLTDTDIDISDSLIPIAPGFVDYGLGGSTSLEYGNLPGIGGVLEQNVTFNPNPGFSPSQMDLNPNFGTSGIGSFDPSSYVNSYYNDPIGTIDWGSAPEEEAPAEEAPAREQETGPRGGTFGPKLKKFFKKLAEIHPATAGPMFAFNVMKGLKNSDDPKAFMQGLMKKLAMRKVMGNFGMSSMQRQGIGSLIGVAQGEQNMAQGLGSFATNAAFSKMMPNILKQAYQSQGMNGVYAAMAALQMARQRAQQGVSRRLAGPGGGG